MFDFMRKKSPYVYSIVSFMLVILAAISLGSADKIKDNEKNKENIKNSSGIILGVVLVMLFFNIYKSYRLINFSKY